MNDISESLLSKNNMRRRVLNDTMFYLRKLIKLVRRAQTLSVSESVSSDLMNEIKEVKKGLDECMSGNGRMSINVSEGVSSLDEACNKCVVSVKKIQSSYKKFSKAEGSGNDSSMKKEVENMRKGLNELRSYIDELDSIIERYEIM